MRIRKVVLRQIYMRQKTPFRLSYRVSSYKNPYLVEVVDEDGISGWGECNVTDGPFFSGETTGSAFQVLTKYLIPDALDKKFSTPEEFFDRTSWIRRNRKARGAVDMALWNLYAKEQGKSEAELLGKARDSIPAGISIGIQDTPEKLVEEAGKALRKGYRKLKLKIKPGKDLDYVRAAREAFPEVPIGVDANGAYTLDDVVRLKELDAFHLTMIEQPLSYDDIVDHAHLQAVLQTAVCLDESVESLGDACRAIALGSCRTINIKLSRVGGLTEARRIAEYAGEKGVPVWCGSTFESGVGAGHNLAAASMANYRYPADIMETGDMFPESEWITRPVLLGKDGTIPVPEVPGSGYDPVPEALAAHTAGQWIFDGK